jgi:hypothetical protein
MCPWAEEMLEPMMLRAMADHPKLDGDTVLLVDVSASMDGELSAKSVMTGMDAACGLAVLAREICQSVQVFTFSAHAAQVAPRRGFALRDAIMHSQTHDGTYLGKSLDAIEGYVGKPHRLIVFTDEQAHDTVREPFAPHAYMVNVAPYKNEVGYGRWVRVNGFSDAVVRWIVEYEKLESRT